LDVVIISTDDVVSSISVNTIDVSLVISSVVGIDSVVISDWIVETKVLISLTIVVTIDELVSMGGAVVVVVVVFIVVIFCVVIPRDVKRLIGRFV
jgi:maltodextrin utilization protein YvdJ